MFFKKKVIQVPSGSTTPIEAACTWTVEWTSRFNAYSTGLRKEFEVVFSEEDAIKLKDSLKEAFKLIRHTSGNIVCITNNQTKKNIMY